MNWFDRLEDLFWTVTGTVAAAVVGFVGWLIRRTITNQKQIEILQTEMRNAKQSREEDREVVREVQQGVNRIEGLLMRSPIIPTPTNGVEK